MSLRTFALVLCVVGGAQLIYTLTLGGEVVGYDYIYFLPRLLEGIAFYRSQGWSIPQYSSWFCGGFPYYADPQVGFYSLPQLLSLKLGVWPAMIVSSFILWLTGFGGCYLLLRRYMELPKAAALAGAFSFAACGFFRTKLAIGHFTYHLFPILPLFLIALHSKRLKDFDAAVILGLLATLVVQSGGNYTGPIFAISILVTSPLLAIWSPVRIQSWCLRAAGGALWAILLSASKLVAGLEFTGNHPRMGKFDSAGSVFEGAYFIFLQLFAPFVPQTYVKDLWEYDASVSIFLLIGVFTALYFAATRLRAKTLPRTKITLGALSLVAFLLAAQFSTGTAAWVHWLQGLPVFEQMRFNSRFTAALILPVVVLSAAGLSLLSGRALQASLALVYIGALLPSALLHEEYKSFMGFDTAGLPKVEDWVRRSKPEELHPTAVNRNAANDFEALKAQATTPNCYSVLFGRPPARTLVDGPLFLSGDGRLNFANPSCYVYPKENGCQRGDRIKAEDAANLELLLYHRNPGWQISRRQYFADNSSRVMLFLTGCWAISFIIRVFRKT